ncbi:MAG: YdbL family protein [Deltaproteobacteria bacterium]|nr:YdbL family protein [Deltaproteobacteria bacterium]
MALHLRRLASLLLLLALGPAPAARALDLDAARAQGLVGEQTDGYVGAVRGEGGAEVAQLVAAVNAKRRAAYEKIAREQGTDVTAVAALAGQKLIARAPAGSWIGDGGRWYQKAR